MTLRAKFTVLSIADYRPYKGYKASTRVTLSAQYSNTPEDNQFSEATPSGELEMTITTDTGREFFKIGKHYFLDFTEVQD